MPSNPLEQAINYARQTSIVIGNLFARIGNSDHPRGILPTAYRNARRGLKTALSERDPERAAAEVMRQLLLTIRQGITPVLTDAQNDGQVIAERQLSFYGYQTHIENSLENVNTVQLRTAIDGVSSVVEQQAQAISLMVRAGVDKSIIIGDAERVGMLRVGDAISSASFWSSSLLWNTFDTAATRTVMRHKDHLMKLAVASLDGRVTECCLNVHGQIVPFDKPFQLTGTPRYADKLPWSPFHRFCRTSIAIYHPEYDKGISEAMRAEANRFRTEKGSRKYFKPAKPGGISSTPTTKQLLPTEQAWKKKTDELIDNWVHGSNNKGSIQFKQAIKNELGLKTEIWNRHGYPIISARVMENRPAVRWMYNQTQADLKNRGVSTIQLFRGIKTVPGDTYVFSAVESWTSDLATAKKFGDIVLVQDVPINRILMYFDGPNWHNGKFGQQYEYIVLSEDPK